MPKHAIPLTDTQIKKSKPKDRNYKLSDGKGLYMIVSTNGGKWWRLDYTFEDKRKTLSLGTYPTVTLVDAREEALRLKRMIHQGIDPLEERKEEKQQIKEDTKLNEFEQKTQLHLVVDEWFKLHEKKVSGYTAGKTRALLDNKFIPYFAKLTSKGYVKTSTPISKIKHYEITALLKEVSKETEYTAKKLKQFLDRIWIFAVTSGYCEQNIISNISNEILPSSKVEHISKITDERSLSQLLHSIENYTGGVMVKASLQFVTYTMLRASTLVNLKWEYVDFEAKTLTIPREQMKVKDSNLSDFVLPLVDQAMDVLEELKPISGRGMYIFSANGKPINKESGNKALRLMGFDGKEGRDKQTMHSFRGTFRSIAETHQSKHNASYETKEAILDHQVGNKVERAYTHKANYTEQMRGLLEWYANFLDEVKNGY